MTHDQWIEFLITLGFAAAGFVAVMEYRTRYT